MFGGLMSIGMRTSQPLKHTPQPHAFLASIHSLIHPLHPSHPSLPPLTKTTGAARPRPREFPALLPPISAGPAHVGLPHGLPPPVRPCGIHVYICVCDVCAGTEKGMGAIVSYPLSSMQGAHLPPGPLPTSLLPFASSRHQPLLRTKHTTHSRTRRAAVETAVAAYGPTSLSLPMLAQTLAFDDVEECRAFAVSKMGCIVLPDDPLSLDVRASRRMLLGSGKGDDGGGGKRRKGRG